MQNDEECENIITFSFPIWGWGRNVHHQVDVLIGKFSACLISISPQIQLLSGEKKKPTENRTSPKNQLVLP